jgi:hypothetical protein
VHVKDDVKNKNAMPRWVRTTVNLDDHIIIPYLDPAVTSANPDQAVEDYLSSPPMDDHSRPLWELHILDVLPDLRGGLRRRPPHAPLPRRRHSLLSLLIACTRSAADPARLPELPPAARRRAAPVRAGLALWVWSYAVFAWHTLVDVVCFVATAWLPARSAHAVRGRVGGRRVRPQALRAPHAQPRRRQVRQECHELCESFSFCLLLHVIHLVKGLN